MLFEDAVLNSGLEGDSALLYALGIYLANGGTRDGFYDLTPDEVQTMLIAYTGTQIKTQASLIKALVKLLGGDTND